MRFRFFIVCLFLINTIYSSFSQAGEYLVNHEPSVLIDQYDFLADSSYQLSIEDVVETVSWEFIHNEFLRPDGAATHWIRFKLKNDSPHHIKKNIRSTSTLFNEMQAYYIDTAQVLHSIDTLGEFTPFSQRIVKTRHAILPITIDAYSEKEVYLYFDRRFLPMASRITLEEPNHSISNTENIAFKGGVFIGIHLFYALVAILIFAIFKRREQLFYILYIIGSLMYSLYAYSHGTFHQALLHPNMVTIYDCLPYIGISLSTVGYLGVFRLILNLRINSPKINNATIVIQVILGISFLVMLSWPITVRWNESIYRNALTTTAVIGILVPPLTLIVSAYSYFKYKVIDHLIFMLTFLPIIAYTVTIWLMDVYVLDRWQAAYDYGPFIMTILEGTIITTLLIRRTYNEKVSLLQAVSDERQHIIEDLHSGLLPEIDTLRMINENYVRPLDNQVANDVDIIQEEVQDDIRSLMWILNREELSTLDVLMSKIRQKVKSRLNNTTTKVHIATTPILLPEDIELPFHIRYHLYHSIKEVVNNIAKHANADNFYVKLDYTPSMISVEMQDDGKGFDIETAKTKNTGHGLIELQRRLSEISPDYDISSAIDQGTHIKFQIPTTQKLGAQNGTLKLHTT